MIEFGRGLCDNLSIAQQREWLVTNGIGGYAAGTVSGIATRRYHGLLVAALQPPLGRTVLLAGIDEMISHGGNVYPLGANRWRGGYVAPASYIYLQRFQLDGSVPTWTYTCGDILLEKRIWMQRDENTTYLQYTVKRASEALSLSGKMLVNYRDYHSTTRAENWQMQILPVEHGVQIDAFFEATRFFVLSDGTSIEPQHTWYRDYELQEEIYRGLDSLDDRLHAANFAVELETGQSITLVVSTEPQPQLDGNAAYSEQKQYEQNLINTARIRPDAPAAVEQLVLAADQFVVRRPLHDNPDGRTIIAGYHWFGDWGRDTMIALPGLTLSTGRDKIAEQILRTFAHFVDQGMLPNRFPDDGETPEYNTVDATLWFFEAVRAYYAATEDTQLIRDLFPVLSDIIDWHVKGTRYNVHVDETDGLLFAGEEGVQLTWMDARVGDWVVTPRIGKPVEVNALWYNALCIMSDFAKTLGEPDEAFTARSEQVSASFARFWNDRVGYCYDVIDEHDAALRPNQLFAVALPYSPLTAEQQRSVVDVCTQQLLTDHGLRSLAQSDVNYQGHYGGNPQQRDGAYHQGTVWSWLIGAFVRAHLRVYKDKTLALTFLEPFSHLMSQHCVGSISEIFDGNAPYTPRGAVAQAWGVAEVLRVLRDLTD